MQLSDYDQLHELEKSEIIKFIEENIEAIYDQRFSYKTFIKPNVLHLAIYENTDTEKEVDRRFIGHWCNKCGDWVEGTDDIVVVEHVIEHLNSVESTTIVDEVI